MTLLRCFLIAAACTFTAGTATAQISFTTAIDLALKNSPRVLAAQADVDKAQAVLSETKDVYIPALSLGSGLGYTYGFPFGAPSLYNVTIQSLLFDQSQRNYIKAARAGLEAANHNLISVRQQVMEDAANTYLSLDFGHRADQGRRQKSRGFATQLVGVVQNRLDVGQDTKIELTRAKLTSANLQLRQIQLEDDASTQREHLAHLTGLPGMGLRLNMTAYLPFMLRPLPR